MGRSDWRPFSPSPPPHGRWFSYFGTSTWFSYFPPGLWELLIQIPLHWVEIHNHWCLKMHFSALPDGVGGALLAGLPSCTAQATALGHSGYEGSPLLWLVWGFFEVLFLLLLFFSPWFFWYSMFFLKSLQRGCFQLMGCPKPSPPARKSRFETFSEGCGIRCAQRTGTGFFGCLKNTITASSQMWPVWIQHGN